MLREVVSLMNLKLRVYWSSISKLIGGKKFIEHMLELEVNFYGKVFSLFI